MASNIVAKRQKATLNDTDGGVVTIPYRVIETDKELTLLLLDARQAAIAQGASDIGIAPASAPCFEVSKNEVRVDLRFNLAEYRAFVDFQEQQSGGSPTPYTPKIINESSARIFPPQPFELDIAYEVLQKQPAGEADTLLLDQSIRAAEIPVYVPIYPPQENYSRRLSVPASILTDQFFYDLGESAHKLNSSAVVFNQGLPGEFTIPSNCLMLLSASIESSGERFGVLRMGFAIGKERDVTWSRTGDNDTVTSETMSGVKPFSQLTYHKSRPEITTQGPASEKLFRLWEHRVWPEVDLDAFLRDGSL